MQMQGVASDAIGEVPLRRQAIFGRVYQLQGFVIDQEPICFILL